MRRILHVYKLALISKDRRNDQAEGRLRRERSFGGMAFRRDAIPFGSMLFGRPLGNPAMSKDATWPSNIGEVIE